MSRRKPGGVAFSLLAFQDIIVSVTGILVLVTLILTLELIRPSAPSTEAAVVRDLLDSIGAVTEEIESMKSALDAGADQISESIAQTPEQVDREIGERGLALDRQNRENEGRSERLDQAEGIRRQSEEEREARSDADKEMEALEAEIARLEEESEQAVRFVGRLTERDGWRVELTGTSILALPMRIVGTAPRFPEAGGPPRYDEVDPTSRAFLDWATSGPIRSSYLLFVIRPSGADRFPMIEEALDQASIQYGYEPIGEDQLLPEPGDESF